MIGILLSNIFMILFYVLKHGLTLVEKIIDIGTGGGFPGLPLKILNPDLDVTLCDSLFKRITFLNEIIANLELEKTTTLHGRAEDLGKRYFSSGKL